MVPFALPRVGLLQQKWKLQVGRRVLYPTFPRCRLTLNRFTFYLRPDLLIAYRCFLCMNNYSLSLFRGTVSFKNSLRLLRAEFLLRDLKVGN